MKPQTSNLFREELRMLLNKSTFIKPQNMNLVLNMKHKNIMKHKKIYRNVRNHISSKKYLENL